VHTEDGGTTWEEQYSSAAGGWFRVVFFTDRNNGWVGWGAATLLHTTDGGASWTTQATGSFTPVECIHFIDSATGWAVSGAYVYNTTDAGASWARSSLQIATHQNVHAVHFTDAQNGWAVSDSGIHRTSDGGKTWINQQRLSNERLYDVYFPDADHGWAVGSGATILHYNTSPASCARAHDTRRSADGLSVRVASNSAKSLIIAYSLKTAADMRLDVFAISGRKIATLEQGFRSAGTHRVVWQNSANNSKKMAAGIYYCALRAKTANRSMVETSSVIIAQ